VSHDATHRITECGAFDEVRKACWERARSLWEEWLKAGETELSRREAFNIGLSLKRLATGLTAADTRQARLMMLLATLAAPLPSVDRGINLGLPPFMAWLMVVARSNRSARKQRVTAAFAVMAKAFERLAIAVAAGRTMGVPPPPVAEL
jgi:hypothetical protein